jgi:hypothetical protein
VRLRRIAVAAVVAPLAALVVLELALRVEGAVRPSATARPPEGTPVVLCVGDSHTRGVPDPDNYPFHLQRLLAERATRPYRVVNLGVPGIPSALVRTRLPAWIAYYRPAVIVFWVGLNNGWRQDPSPWRRGPLARVGSRSRAVQMLRLARFAGGLRFDRLERDGFEATDWSGTHGVWRVDFAGHREDINTVPAEALPEAEVEATTRDDVRAMAAAARGAGIRTYAITYVFPTGYYGAVNRGLRAAAQEVGMPVVETQPVAGRLLKEPGEPLFDPSVHPAPRLYRAVAEAVYETLAADGALGPAG